MEEGEPETIQIKQIPELWELAGGWINANVLAAPTTLKMYSVAATLLHVAACSWAQFIPPPEAGGVFKYDEETFVDLARQMFRRAAATRSEG